MNKRELARVNAQILNAEKRYGKESAILQRVYDTINKAYGTEGRTRFKMPSSDATFKEKTIIDRAMDTVLVSKYMSAAGRREMIRKSKESFSKSHDYSDAQVEKLYDFFENSADLERMKELAGEAYSEQLVDAIMSAIDYDENITPDVIDNLFELYLKADDNSRDENFFDILNRLSGGEDLQDIINDLEGVELD